MLPYERRQGILTVLGKEGTATVRDLATEFEVSVVTIRRDLQRLEEDGLVAKTHGGAVILGRNTHAELRLTEREQQYREEKRRIAESAAKLIHPGATIILDEGSTCLEIARILKNLGKASVITNGVRIAAELLGSSINLILIGGMCDHESAMLYGPDTEKAYKGLRADIYFMGIDAFSEHDGIMDANFLQVNLKNIKAHAAQQVIGVAHGAKYGKRAISQVGPLTLLDALVTDTPVDSELQESLRKNNIRCVPS